MTDLMMAEKSPCAVAEMVVAGNGGGGGVM